MGKIALLLNLGNPHSTLNYKPISLTSEPRKLQEHVIHTSLVALLALNMFFEIITLVRQSWFPSLIAYFQPSTTDLLLIAFFLILPKAFDKVSHRSLIFKISKWNVDPCILKCIECFLNNRMQHVTANYCVSACCDVTSSVPQGSCVRVFIISQLH